MQYKRKITIKILLFLIMSLLMLWWSQWIWTLAFIFLFVLLGYVYYRTRKENGILISTLRLLMISVAMFFLAIWSRLFLLETYTVQTSSMYPTIKPGAIIFTEKWSYGFHKPTTLAQIPWLNILANRSDSSDFPDSSQFRVGFRGIQRGDIVVFIPPGSEIPHVKRCVAIAGDSVSVFNGVEFVNGKPQENSWAVFPYLIVCNKSDEFLCVAKNKSIHVTQQDSFRFRAFLTLNERKELENLSVVDSVLFLSRKLEAEFYRQNRHIRTMILDTSSEKHAFLSQLFPNTTATAHDFPSLHIPQKEHRVVLSDSVLPLFKTMIENDGGKFDYKHSARNSDTVLTREYQFKHNHLFVLGDNRTNSLDSKDWGTLPENRVLSKVIFIWN